MKYFRVKDGRIFKVLKEDERFYCVSYLNGVGFSLWDKHKKDIVKEANTIEELCDYLILFIDDDIYPTFYELFWQDKVEQVKRITAKELKNNRQIKLGILTDKGLIYVAKMNDKGELELL